MQFSDFVSEVVNTDPVQTAAVWEPAEGFYALLLDDEVADLLAVTTDWVRSHAVEIPGFCPLGMYCRFHRTPVEKWLGGLEHLLEPGQVAELLKVPRSWVYQNADQIPGILRLGRYVRFRPALLRVFLSGSQICQ